MPPTDPVDDRPTAVKERDLMDPVQEWMIESTRALERLGGRLEAVEKSVDQNTQATTAAAAAAGAAANALTRIAKVEEDRLAFDVANAKAKKESDKEERGMREAWMNRLWTSQPLQLLLLGVVMVILNLLGVSYLADKFVPSVTPPAIESPAERR